TRSPSSASTARSPQHPPTGSSSAIRSSKSRTRSRGASAGPPRGQVEKAPHNRALEDLASFRETHSEFAQRSVPPHLGDRRGTPCLNWLCPLIDETPVYLIP